MYKIDLIAMWMLENGSEYYSYDQIMDYLIFSGKRNYGIECTEIGGCYKCKDKFYEPFNHSDMFNAIDDGIEF